MKRLKTAILFSVILVLAAVPSAFSLTRPGEPAGRRTAGAAEKENVMVGRIAYIEGELLRYVPSDKDWAVTVKDTPFGLEDALYSGEDTKAEIIMPNNTWLRVGPNTQIQMITLKPDLTEVDVASGVARFYDRGSKTVIKATTPYGYVTAEPGSAFDLYVGDESVEVIGVTGSVAFVHDADGARYLAKAGEMSILADSRQVTSGEGKVDSSWDDWNAGRESLWAKNLETKGDSAQYLPEGIREDAPTLDENGKWDRVYYEGAYRNYWRPTNVEPDWAPYTAGRWTTWYGDQCWVPYEPFGWVTHHYGSWVYLNDYWYWAPPVVTVGWPWWGFYWYPGRVAWAYSDWSIGWYPLAWWEPFFCFNYWGPNCFFWGGGFHHHHYHHYAYAGHTTAVSRNHFYSVNNYRTAGITRVNGQTLASRYKTAPVVNGINNLDTRGQNHFTNATASAKPGQSMTARIAQNQSRAQQSAALNGNTIRQQTAGASLGKPAAGGAVQQPRAAGTAAQARDLKQNPRQVQAGARIQQFRGAGGQRENRMASPQGRTGRSAYSSSGGAARVRPERPQGRVASPGSSAGGPASPRQQYNQRSGGGTSGSSGQFRQPRVGREQAPGLGGGQYRGGGAYRGGGPAPGEYRGRAYQGPMGGSGAMRQAPQGRSFGGGHGGGGGGGQASHQGGNLDKSH